MRAQVPEAAELRSLYEIGLALGQPLSAVLAMPVEEVDGWVAFLLARADEAR